MKTQSSLVGTDALSEKSEHHVLWLFMAIQFTLILDFMLLMPLGPSLIEQMDLSAGSFGAVVACYSLCSAVCGFSGAFWMDRVRHDRLLIVLYLVFTFATAGCALANGPIQLTLARSVAGGAAGLLWAGVLAIIIDIVPPQRRGDAIGLVMSAYAVAAVLGVPLGLFTAAEFGWRAPFAFLAGASLVLCLVLRRVLAKLPTRTEKSAGRAEPATTVEAKPAGPGLMRSLHELGQPTFVTGWILSFSVVCAGFLMIPYIGTFLTNNLALQPRELAVVYLVGGAATFITSRLVGRAVDAKGPVICLALLLVATWLPHLVLTHLTEASFAQVVLTFTLFMTLTSGRMIPTITLISERVPPALRGRFMAVNTAMTDVASGAASALGGVLLTTHESGRLLGFGRVGVLACSVSLVALAVLAAHLRTRQGTQGTLQLGEET